MINIENLKSDLFKNPPKLLYWFEMPVSIGEEEILELLKRDILLIRCSGVLNKIMNIKIYNSDYSIFLYNIDKMLLVNNISRDNVAMFSGNLIQFIKVKTPQRAMIHTTLVDKNISNLFKSEGIPYLEKNLDDKKIAVSTIISYVLPQFMENNKMGRSFFRVDLYPMKYKVELRNNDISSPIVDGFIKDISMNGLSIVCANKNDLNFFKLKDRVTIKMFIKAIIIKINLSFVTRINEDLQEIAFTYDITNSKMVSEIDSDNITKIIYQRINQILEGF